MDFIEILGGLIIAGAVFLNYHLFGTLTSVYHMKVGVLKGSGYWHEVAIAFIGGLLSAPYIVFLIKGYDTKFLLDDYVVLDPYDYVNSHLNIWGWLLAGFVLGMGATMARGGFTYHVLSGVPSLSFSSIILGALIFTGAILMATFRQYWKFLEGGSTYSDFENLPDILWWVALIIFILLSVLVVLYLIKYENKLQYLFHYIVGGLLGFGFVIGNLLRVSKVIAFFDWAHWTDSDYTIVFTIVSAVLATILLFILSKLVGGPVWGVSDSDRYEVQFGIKEIIGALLYGCSWGFSGFALGPGIAGALIYPSLLLWLLGVGLGMMVCGFYEKQSGGSDGYAPLN